MMLPLVLAQSTLWCWIGSRRDGRVLLKATSNEAPVKRSSATGRSQIDFIVFRKLKRTVLLYCKPTRR